MRRSHGWRFRLVELALVMAPLLAMVVATRAAPPRVANPHGKFRGECGDCHAANAWKPARISAKFDHSKFGFRLEGAHAAAGCTGCHASLDFTQERQLCVSCHEDVHQGEFGSECAACHTARSFIDRTAMVRRHNTSRFPLSGSHAALDCEECHPPAAGGQARFVGQPADCVSCHRADYEAAKSPDHVLLSFSLDCMNCHTTLTWSPARFDHSGTGFPLTGRHTRLPCTSCHTGGTYQGLSPDCAACHQDEYDATTNPSHGALGFSTQCQTCHSTAGWGGATFDHDTQNFPIYSGRHAGIWSSCSTCHTNSADYTQFTCFNCHPHSDQGKTDETHSGVNGYTYTSQACYTCHPRGRH